MRTWKAYTTVVIFAVTQEGDVIDGTTPTTVTFAPTETAQKP